MSDLFSMMETITKEHAKMIIKPDFPQHRPKNTKRMLDIVEDKDSIKVYINSSSINLLNECKQKAKYVLMDKYSGGDTPAKTYGTAVHKAMEYLYTTPIKDRDLVKMHDKFIENAKSLELIEDAHDKHSITNGLTLLSQYFETYCNDPWQVVELEGKPLVEHNFEFRLGKAYFLEKLVEIYYHGTIDAIMKNKETEQVAIFDHKTTGSMHLSRNMIKPNNQFLGYFYYANLRLDIKPDLMIMNLLEKKNQIAKTSRGIIPAKLERIEGYYTEEEFKEFETSVISNVMSLLDCKGGGVWPMNAPNACNGFSGCEFQSACASNPKLRKPILESMRNR